MPCFPSQLRVPVTLRPRMFAAASSLAVALLSTHAAGLQPPQTNNPSSQESPARDPQPPISNYDKAIFSPPIATDQLLFLNHFAGVPAKKVLRDKQFAALMRSTLPASTFHYGWDLSPFDAFERVLSASPLTVQIRDGRYFAISGRNGPYLQGRALVWIDMQEGIALAAFYFHPTNGEPTPTLTVFSGQLKEESLRLSQLPPEFVEALAQWSAESGVPTVTTRYYIGSSNKKFLLEHDEDYCTRINPAIAISADTCEAMNADAADIDLNAAYYLEQTNHATNATEWMITGPEQTAWIELRDNSCRARPDLLRCRIVMTRERTHVILTRPPVVHPPLPHPPHH